MSLRARFTADLKTAMVAKEQDKVSTLRLIMAALKDKDIAARPSGVTDGIPDDQILSLLQGMIKQRRESIEQFEKGNRPELAAREQAEITVIETYLPAQMSDTEVESAIESAVKAAGATSIKDMGKVMAEIKQKYAGQMDFTKASALVKQKLAG
jgi:uncharacterized protein YqeY